jgi:hypothetical protein
MVRFLVRAILSVFGVRVLLIATAVTCFAVRDTQFRSIEASDRVRAHRTHRVGSGAWLGRRHSVGVQLSISLLLPANGLPAPWLGTKLSGDTERRGERAVPPRAGEN